MKIKLPSEPLTLYDALTKLHNTSFNNEKFMDLFTSSNIYSNELLETLHSYYPSTYPEDLFRLLYGGPFISIDIQNYVDSHNFISKHNIYKYRSYGNINITVYDIENHPQTNEILSICNSMRALFPNKINIPINIIFIPTPLKKN